MKKHERKSHPINRNIVKLKRILTGKKARDPHKLYPDEYYRQYWLRKPYSKGIDLIAKSKRISKRAAVNEIIFWGFKHVMGELVAEELKAQDNPTERAAIAKRTRFILELRRRARENGWDINKLF
jgi:hypothetical protein